MISFVPLGLHGSGAYYTSTLFPGTHFTSLALAQAAEAGKFTVPAVQVPATPVAPPSIYGGAGPLPANAYKTVSGLTVTLDPSNPNIYYTWTQQSNGTWVSTTHALVGGPPPAGGVITQFAQQLGASLGPALSSVGGSVGQGLLAAAPTAEAVTEANSFAGGASEASATSAFFGGLNSTSGVTPSADLNPNDSQAFVNVVAPANQAIEAGTAVVVAPAASGAIIAALKATSNASGVGQGGTYFDQNATSIGALAGATVNAGESGGTSSATTTAVNGVLPTATKALTAVIQPLTSAMTVASSPAVSSVSSSASSVAAPATDYTWIVWVLVVLLLLFLLAR